MNRRLIRPNLSEIKEKLKAAEIAAPKPAPAPPVHEPRGGHPSGPHPQGPHGGPHMQKKVHPPSDTSGETIEGYIEWYDRTCIKLNREGAPNLLVYKNAIKYLYKLDEGKEGGEGETDDRR
jgi:host factor-I protein